MHYLIFVPHVEGEKLDLDEIGYGDFKGAEHLETTHTPTGMAGFLYAWRKPHDPVDARQLAYLPDVQTWEESSDARYWIGFWDAYPPRPEELQKQEEIDGMSVQLDDGCFWTVPIAANLPQCRFFIENRTEQRIHNEYADVWQVSCDIADLLTRAQDDESIGIECDDRFAFYALALLRIHYRITPEVANHLKLLSDKNIAEIVMKSLIGHERMPPLDIEEG